MTRVYVIVSPSFLAGPGAPETIGNREERGKPTYDHPRSSVVRHFLEACGPFDMILPKKGVRNHQPELPSRKREKREKPTEEKTHPLKEHDVGRFSGS